MTNRDLLWPIEPLPGARLVALRPARRPRVRPLWDWRWDRIGLDIGLPLLFLAAFVIVGWGGLK